MDDVVTHAKDGVAVERDAEGFVGEVPDLLGGAVFGGFLLAQAVHAVTRDAPEDKRLHSLHAYFLRPARPGTPLRHRVDDVREGRSFVARQLEAAQEGKPVLRMTCSFAADGEGYEYAMPAPTDVPRPDDVGLVQGPAPGWDLANIGPSEPDDQGVRTSTARLWIRPPQPVQGDAGMHAALLAYLTDMTWTGSRPLHLDGDPRGVVSLDHALWIHRPPRLDDWHLYDVQALVNTAGRGLVRGSVYDGSGRLVATAVQEVLVRRYEDLV